MERSSGDDGDLTRLVAQGLQITNPVLYPVQVWGLRILGRIVKDEGAVGWLPARTTLKWTE